MTFIIIISIGIGALLYALSRDGRKRPCFKGCHGCGKCHHGGGKEENKAKGG